MEFLKPPQFACDPCGSRNNAAHYCNTCHKNLCNICSENHRTHDIVSFESVSGMSVDLSGTHVVGCVNYDSQTDKDFTVFCQDCKILVSERSKHAVHKGHRFINNTDACWPQAKYLMDLQCRAKELLESQKIKIERGKYLQSKVEEHFTELKKVLDDRLADQQRQIEAKTSKQCEIVRKSEKEIKQAEDLLNNTADPNFSKRCAETADALKTYLETQQAQRDVCIHFTQACTVEDFKTVVAGLGTVTEQRLGKIFCFYQRDRS